LLNQACLKTNASVNNKLSGHPLTNQIMPKQKRRFLQVDVFSKRPGAGNPLAVVLDAEGLNDAQMQAIATWTNLVETTFVLPPSQADADYRVRIFTPQREIPFAGHPSLGTAHALLVAKQIHQKNAEIVQECGAGLIPIRIETSKKFRRRLFFRAPAVKNIQLLDTQHEKNNAVFSRLNLGELPPALVEGGRKWWLAEMQDETSLRSLVPDHAAIIALSKASDSMGLCVFSRCRNQDYQLAVRAFAPAFGIHEDPASGAANATIAAYLLERGALNSIGHNYRVSQGREMGHDATIDLRAARQDDIWVGGECQTVIHGDMEW
jgi:PhzF family phenazine biosynthesis protein